jgi:hypothetical protein
MFLVLLGTTSSVLLSTSAVNAVASGYASDVDGTPNPDSPEVHLEATRNIAVPDFTSTSNGVDGLEYAYTLSLDCTGNGPGDVTVTCPAAEDCPDPAAMSHMVWQRPLPNGAWEAIGSVCLAPEEAARPQVTPDLVLNEVRRIGLPALQVHVQPAGDTLVNLDTIFYAEPLPFVRTVQLLGYTVDVDATPTAYDWSFGDGTGQVTESPGAPYPAGDITHAYTDAHVTQQASVDAIYTVRFRVDGGEWQTIEETITADGPSTAVTVKEAVPVLTGE